MNAGILNVASVSDYGVASSIGTRAAVGVNTLNVFSGGESAANNFGVGLHFRGGTLQYTGSTPQSTNRNIRIVNGAAGSIDASGSNPAATLSFTHTGANVNLFDTAGVRTLTLTGTNTGANGFSILLQDQAANATSLAKTGVGTWSLNGPDTNTATGATSVLGGTLILNKTAATAVSGPLTIGNGSASALLQLSGTGGNQIADTSVATLSGTGATAGVLRLGNLSETIGGLASTGGAGIVENESGSAGTGTLSLNVTGSQSYSGSLRDGDGVGTDGVLALTKLGAGTQTLTGTTTYSGATTLNAGRLQLNGSAAAGTLQTSGIAVNSTSTLGFTAAAASTLTMKAGSTLTLNGGTVNLDLGPAAGGTDLIAADAVTLTSNTNFSFNQIGALDFGSTYTLVSSNTPISNGGGFSIPATTSGRLTITPIVGANAITMTASLDNATWTNAAGANWGPDLTNWSNYNPNVAGDAALFGPALLASGTVTVDAAKAVGYITFDNSAASYTIGTAGSSNLTLNSGGAFAAQIINTAGNHFIAENVALSTDATVVSAAGTTLTISGTISGARALTKAGNGTLVLTNSQTYSGGTSVLGGTLRLGDGVTDGAITGAVSNNGTVNFNNAAPATFAGAISGSGAVTKTSNGVLTLTGVNTYTGGTTISAGSVDVGGGTATGSITGTVTNNASLRFSQTGAVTLTSVVNGSGTTIVSGGGTQILGPTASINTPNVTVGDALLGQMTFGAANQLNGTTGVVLNIAAHASNSRINMNGFSQTIAGLTGTGIIQSAESGTVAASALTLNIPGSNSYSWTGLIRRQAAAGALSLIKNGTGEQIMNFQIQNQTHDGPTVINQGRLTFGSTFAAQVFTTPSVTVAAGAEFGLTGAGASVVSWSGGVLVTGAGNLVRTGADVNTVSITNATNSFTGYTKLSGTGTLSVGSLANIGANSAIGAGSAGANADSLIFDGGTLRYTGAAVNTDRLFTLTQNGGTFDSSGSGAVNFNNGGALATSGSGARTLVLTGTNTGSNTLAGGLADGAGGATSLVKNLAGTWVLSGANSFTGATTLNNGRLQLQGLAATGTLATSDIAVNGGTFGFTTGAATTLTSSGSLTLNGGTLNFDLGSAGVNDVINVPTLNVTANSALSFNPNQVGTLALGSTYTLANFSTLNNGGGFTLSAASSGRLQFATVLGATTLTVTPTLDTTEWSSATGGVWGTGPWSGYTPFAAGDAPLFGNALTASDTVTLESAKSSGYITFNNAAASYTIGTSGSSNLTLDSAGANPALISVVAGTHTIAENVALASDVLVSTSASTSLSIRGVISGAKALTKTGNGTLTLSAANSYTGLTTISAGTLALGDGVTNGSVAGSIVNDGALVMTSVFDQTYGGNISGSGSLTKNGNAILRLNGANSFGGAVTLNAGTIEIGNATALGAGTAVITINGGVLRAAAAARTVTNPITANGSFTLGRLTDFANTVTLGANITITANNYDAPANNNSRFIGAITGPFRVSFAEGPQLIGTGALVIENTNTNSGGTSVESGRVTVNPTGALANADLTVNGGILNLNNSVQSVTSFSGTGGTVNLAANTSLIVAQTSDTTYSGAIAGASGAVVKQGSGRLTLDGILTFGTLDTEAGTTDLASALGSGSSVLVANAETNISVSQTLASLTIGDGAVVTLGSPLPPAPAAEFGIAFEPGGNAPLQGVPEPGSAALLFGGMLTILGLRRRR